MIIDMPLPMPRWLIISPIHINSAVPDTKVMITSRARGMNCGSSTTLGALRPAPKKALPRPWPKMNVSPVACSVAMAIAR